MVLQTDLCIGATVTISSINIVPKAGLYNGARGTIVDYLCAIVDFPGLKLGNAKPWDELNPTSNAITFSTKFTHFLLACAHSPFQWLILIVRRNAAMQSTVHLCSHGQQSFINFRGLRQNLDHMTQSTESLPT
ncbi:hypothetical protein ACHAWF_007334 [Thalassiosira exigua]